jgi:O-antigen/teichoic acid export membrane protein
MISIRRALAFSFGQKYGLAAIQMLSTIAVARLLSPAEIGVFMVGNAVVSMTEVFRDFGVTTYLIQAREITLTRIRTAFTVTFLLSALLSASLLALSGEIAAFYREAGVRHVLYLAAANCLMVPFAATVMTLLRRELAFDALVRINLASTLSYCSCLVGLAAMGFGYMSFSWAVLASTVFATLVSLIYCPNLRMFIPGVTEWRQVLSFGSISSSTALLNSLYTNLPQLFLGRILDLGAVGLYNRATVLCQLFDRFVLDGVNPVVLPAFAARVRNGDELRTPYLRALAYITALHWPFLLCLALLADPAVRLLLGGQWLEAVPLVRIIALASLWLFPAFLTAPLLISLGRVRDTLTMSLITLPISLALLLGASFLGLQAVAASLFLTTPLQVYVAFVFIRRQIHFTWGELAGAVRRSALVALCAAAAPAVAVAAAGFRLDISIPVAILAGIGAVAGWLGGLALTNHPLWKEVRGVALPALQAIAIRLPKIRAKA